MLRRSSPSTLPPAPRVSPDSDPRRDACVEVLGSDAESPPFPPFAISPPRLLSSTIVTPLFFSPWPAPPPSSLCLPDSSEALSATAALGTPITAWSRFLSEIETRRPLSGPRMRPTLSLLPDMDARIDSRRPPLTESRRLCRLSSFAGLRSLRCPGVRTWSPPALSILSTRLSFSSPSAAIAAPKPRPIPPSSPSGNSPPSA